MPNDSAEEAELRMIPRACQAALAADDLIAEMLQTEAMGGARRIGTTGIAPLKFGEETLSESMLARLSTMFADVVDVVMFTRMVEARRTGADWLWCLDTPSGRYFMLVQAKRPNESMANGPHPWTVTLSSEPNKHTGKTQHSTLVDAAAALRVTPCYCFFLPAIVQSECEEQVRLARLNFWHYPPLAFIHLLPAAKIAPGTHEFALRRPNSSFTLVELLCCMLAGDKPGIAKFGDDIIAPMDLTFENIVERIANNEEFQSISGAMEIRIERNRE